MSALTRVLFGDIDPYLPTILFAIIAAAALIRTIVLVTRMIAAKKEKRKPAKRVRIAAGISAVLVPLLAAMSFLFKPTIIVDDFPEYVELPDLTGMDYKECKAEYSDWFDLSAVERLYSSEYPEGAIIEQSRDSGEYLIYYGKPLNVKCIISAGPRMVTVPNVVSVDFDTAEKICKEYFIIEIESEEYSDEYPAGTVISISPEQGEKLEYGGVIKFVVSKGSEYENSE